MPSAFCQAETNSPVKHITVRCHFNGGIAETSITHDEIEPQYFKKILLQRFNLPLSTEFKRLTTSEGTIEVDAKGYAYNQYHLFHYSPKWGFLKTLKPQVETN